MHLTRENYNQGFLIDEEMIAGITQNPTQPGAYIAFIMRHTTGEYLGYQPFTDLDDALKIINTIERDWVFEKGATGATGGCGSSCASENGARCDQHVDSN